MKGGPLTLLQRRLHRGSLPGHWTGEIGIAGGGWGVGGGGGVVGMPRNVNVPSCVKKDLLKVCWISLKNLQNRTKD